MLNLRTPGFSLVEALVALMVLLAGIAGAALLLLQTVQYERESANRRAALRFAGSLAEELRALRPADGAAMAPDIAPWAAQVEAAMPVGTIAGLRAAGTTPPQYGISIEWPVAGGERVQLRLAVTP